MSQNVGSGEGTFTSPSGDVTFDLLDIDTIRTNSAETTLLHSDQDTIVGVRTENSVSFDTPFEFNTLTVSSPHHSLSPGEWPVVHDSTGYGARIDLTENDTAAFPNSDYIHIRMKPVDHDLWQHVDVAVIQNSFFGNTVMKGGVKCQTTIPGRDFVDFSPVGRIKICPIVALDDFSWMSYRVKQKYGNIEDGQINGHSIAWQPDGAALHERRMGKNSFEQKYEEFTGEEFIMPGKEGDDHAPQFHVGDVVSDYPHWHYPILQDESEVEEWHKAMIKAAELDTLGRLSEEKYIKEVLLGWPNPDSDHYAGRGDFSTGWVIAFTNLKYQMDATAENNTTRQNNYSASKLHKGYGDDNMSTMDTIADTQLSLWHGGADQETPRWFTQKAQQELESEMRLSKLLRILYDNRACNNQN